MNEDVTKDRSRAWVSQPEMTDEAIVEATGKGWDEWCEIIDAWPGHEDGHAAIARYVQAEHGVSGWWAQSVTVGYERIRGLRLPHQQPDGTFTANTSRTLSTDGAALREGLLDPAGRDGLFPGMRTELRSRPESKNVRIALDEGTAEIAIEPRSDGRVRVVVSHAKLSAPGDVDRWKAYWSEWLGRVDGG